MMKTSLFIGTAGMPEIPCAHIYRESVGDNVKKAAACGFDGVELITCDPAQLDVGELEAALRTHGMKIACINTGRLQMEYGLTLIHAEAGMREKAFGKLADLIAIAARLGCDVNIGLFRGPALSFQPIRKTRDMFVGILKDACAVAKKAGVRINFEPTNRFETNYINTTAEGLDIIARVGADNLGLLLDLYHVYIEDPDMEESILGARRVLRHMHFSDSDRWPAGLGHGEFDFARLIALLKYIGYDGYLSEGLVPTDDVDASARKTAAFLRRLIAT